MPASNFTRCPECATVFRVTEQHLQLARGKVRCGACLTVFFAPDYFVKQKAQPSAPTSREQSTPAADAKKATAVTDTQSAVDKPSTEQSQNDPISHSTSTDSASTASVAEIKSESPITEQQEAQKEPLDSDLDAFDAELDAMFADEEQTDEALSSDEVLAQDELVAEDDLVAKQEELNFAKDDNSMSSAEETTADSIEQTNEEELQPSFNQDLDESVDDIDTEISSDQIDTTFYHELELEDLDTRSDAEIDAELEAIFDEPEPAPLQDNAEQTEALAKPQSFDSIDNTSIADDVQINDDSKNFETQEKFSSETEQAQDSESVTQDSTEDTKDWGEVDEQKEKTEESPEDNFEDNSQEKSDKDGFTDRELADINKYLAKSLDPSEEPGNDLGEYDPSKESLDNLSLGDVELDDLDVEDFDLDEDDIENFLKEAEETAKQESSEFYPEELAEDIVSWDADNPKTEDTEEQKPTENITEEEVSYDNDVFDDATDKNDAWVEEQQEDLEPLYEESDYHTEAADIAEPLDNFSKEEQSPSQYDELDSVLAGEPLAGHEYARDRFEGSLDESSLEPDPLDEFDEFVEKKSHRWKWLSITVVILTGLAWGGWTLWSERQSLAWDDTWGGTVQTMCSFVPCDLKPRRDVDAIELVQRDIRPSEQNPNLLEFNLLIKNNATFDQPFPTVTIIFTDTEGKTVATEQHPPSSYIDAQLNLETMPRGQTIQILVVSKSTYPNAPGFQFDFE